MSEETRSQVLKKFNDYAGKILNPSVENVKSADCRVVGYFCSFIPEELFIAAGLLPFRMRGTGSETTERADEYFTSCNCSFPRHCFNQALTGEYTFLDGLVVGTSCDATRYIYDNWKSSPIKTPFIYLLGYPHVSGVAMANYYRAELAKLKTALEEQFGARITDEKLRSAITLCNETRELQRQLYEMRKSASPPITGSEMVSVMVAGVSMPKDEYNADLKQLIEELEALPATNSTYAARLMVVGSCGDDDILSRLAEEQGALVVTDHTCFGGKLKYGAVDEAAADPLQALAKYQILTRPFCAKVGGAYQLRAKVILDAAKEFGVDGVLGQRLGCCDTWGGELYALKEDLKGAGIPSLMIEREYVPDSEGQLATRVQAFIETVRR
ncbi:MAG: 2-hydroxyacyl-CoA dehydratase family protein [Deltaproteobacteria bacterium]